MTARWWAFGAWALVAASLLYWGLRLFAPATPAPAHTQVASASGGPRGDLTRLLGVDAAPPAAEEEEAPPPEASRFQLVGVVAPRGGSVSQGVALISVDGQAPKAYRVGTPIDGDTVLHSVKQRSAMLGPRGAAASMTLEIPAPEPAATGTLPAALPGGAAPPPQQRAQGVPGPAGVIRPLPNGVRAPQPMMQGQVVSPMRAMPPQAVPQQQPPNQEAE